MKTLNMVLLACALTGPVVWAQVRQPYSQSYTSQSQETVNALQSQRLDQLERLVSEQSAINRDLQTKMTLLQSSVDQFRGIGLGFGIVIGLLQLLGMIQNFRNGKLPGSNNRG